MTARTAEEAKEEVRNATDIVATIGERVPLRRAGRSWKGLCPFHTERTPSFTVNPERQMWHCFGCSRGGDVFAFVMEADGRSFPEALAWLADRAGIELPRAGRGPGQEARERLYQANALAADFFAASLRSSAGESARTYLAGRRLGPDLLERFRIGWAPGGWDALALRLGKLEPSAVLEEAGLLVRRGDGSHYDRFRNRIMFPIDAAAGRIAGFGARAIEEGDQPKYLNSPETPVFRKGSLLFALGAARAAIRQRKQVLIVEGYLDAMRLHDAGHENAVSTCGTALTLDQARRLARFDAEAVLVYDGDDAGIRAADRALLPLLAAGMTPRVLLLPPGEDPDSLIVARGAEAFTGLLAKALDLPGFLATARLGGDAEDPSTEARVRRLVELLRSVEDPIRRRLLLRRGAEVFRLEEDVLVEAARRGSSQPPSPRGRSRSAAGAGPGGERATAPERPAASHGGTPGAAIDPIERELAARVLTEDGAVAELAEHGGAGWCRNPGIILLIEPWLKERRAPYPDELRALTGESPLARAILAEHAVEEGRTDAEARRGARELLDRLEERRIRASIHELDEAIRMAEGAKDEGALGRLLAERRDLASKLHGRSHTELT